MTTSSILPSYPGSIFPWTDRVDGTSVDYAADINSVAAEIESVENTTGTNPQTEPTPPTGIPVVYSTLSARVSDAMNNARLPYAVMSVSSFNVPPLPPGVMVPFKAGLDPYSSFNGTDFTAPASGWWQVSATAVWNWWNQGYTYQSMTVNGLGNIVADDLIDWSFSGNTLPATTNSIPGVIPVPTWQVAGKRPRTTNTFFQGPLHKGDRVSVYAENGTSQASYPVGLIQLQAIMIRTITGTFTST